MEIAFENTNRKHFKVVLSSEDIQSILIKHFKAYHDEIENWAKEFNVNTKVNKESIEFHIIGNKATSND